jgi:hypothetical protein
MFLNCFLNSVSTAVVFSRAVLPCNSLMLLAVQQIRFRVQKSDKILHFTMYLGEANMQQHRWKQHGAKTWNY